MHLNVSYKTMNKIPIYVINLRRTPERRLYMQRQLDSFGLEYQWIEAVDAYDFTDTDLEGVDLNAENQPMAMACLLSHIKFYDQVIKNNHEIACVLEDDSELLPAFPDILNYEKLQKEDWEILLLLHFCPLTTKLLKEYHQQFLTSDENREDFAGYYQYVLGTITKNTRKKYTKNYYLAKIAKPYLDGWGQPMGTGAYLVRLSAAKKLKKIALANQKFILSDDLTGCADALGISLKLITPPCVRSNPTYTQYSAIVSKDAAKVAIIPHQKILQLHVRNKWAVLAPFIFNCGLSMKLRIKLGLFLLCQLKDFLYQLKIERYLNPQKAFNPRIIRIIKKKT